MSEETVVCESCGEVKDGNEMSETFTGLCEACVWEMMKYGRD